MEQFCADIRLHLRRGVAIVWQLSGFEEMDGGDEFVAKETFLSFPASDSLRLYWEPLIHNNTKRQRELGDSIKGHWLKAV